MSTEGKGSVAGTVGCGLVAAGCLMTILSPFIIIAMLLVLQQVL